MIFCCLFLSAIGTSYAQANHKDLLDFSLFKLGTAKPTMLIIGGIQGDEPGGFSAATLVATRYSANKGSLWIVPNLNFPSIIKRSRGVHGDMNRKFAILSNKDPQYAIVNRIQKLIRSEEVDIILNLHDGSGFYRPVYKDALHGPARWGQSVIIDQEFMPNFDPQNKECTIPTLPRVIVKWKKASLGLLYAMQNQLLDLKQARNFLLYAVLIIIYK